jgi:hypothetical protein
MSRGSLGFALVASLSVIPSAVAEGSNPFQGRIEIVAPQGGQPVHLRYTAGADFLRIEVTGSDAPNPVDVVDLTSGAMTFLYPHNRSFLRLKSGSSIRGPVAVEAPPDARTKAPIAPGMPPMPAPPGVVPQAAGNPPGSPPLGAGRSVAPNLPAMPNMPPGMPAMPFPPSMGEKIELKPTGKKKNILGYACEQFEVKSRGETTEIWATDKLLPFQPYLRTQTRRFGPAVIEEQWATLLTANKLFPLRVSLRSDNGVEHLNFEVISITPGKIADPDGKLFQPPRDYTETQPLQF